MEQHRHMYSARSTALATGTKQSETAEYPLRITESHLKTFYFGPCIYKKMIVSISA